MLNFGKKNLGMRPAALGIAKRLLMVATADYYGHHVTRADYGNLFEDLIKYGLVDEYTDGTLQLSKQGVKVANRLNEKIYQVLRKG